MWRTPRNHDATAKDNSEPANVVRRTRVVVERRICSVEIHGGVQLQHGQACPLCGQTLPAPQSQSALAAEIEAESDHDEAAK
jgi:hypothetical protein